MNSLYTNVLKQLPIMAKVNPPNTKLIYCLCIFPLNYDAYAIVQTFKFPIYLTRQKGKNTLQKQHTSDVVLLTNGSTTQRAPEQISLIS